MITERSVSADQPATFGGQPPNVTGQPVKSGGQLPTITGQPVTVRSRTVDGQPSKSIGQPIESMGQPIINLSVAEQFLNRFGWPNTFQSFDDAGNGRRELVRIIHAAQFSDVSRELTRLNNAGAGIFFTVNQTDGRGRKETNIVRVRALFVDADGTPLPRGWHKCPNIMVWREAGEFRWHAYWLTDSVPLDKFSECQKRLAAHYGTDTAIHDLPRVMRVPGFIHRKADPQDTYCHIQERTAWTN